MLEFFISFFQTGVGYTSIGAVRSVLFYMIVSPKWINSWKQWFFPRYIKESLKICPIRPKYETTWDPDIALTYFDSLPDNNELRSLKQLSQILAKNLCLLSDQRDQTTSRVSMNHMAPTDNNFDKYTLIISDKCTFFIFELIKTTRPRHH